MGLGVSLFLIAIGAILTWAVNAEVSGVDIQTVGVILLVVGVGRTAPRACCSGRRGAARRRSASGAPLGERPTSKTALRTSRRSSESARADSGRKRVSVACPESARADSGLETPEGGRFAAATALGGLRSHGELDGERRARALVGLDPDAAVHAAHQLAADVEAEPGAADAAGEVRVEAEELLEDAAVLGGRDAEPLVADEEADAPSPAARRGPRRGRRRAST